MNFPENAILFPNVLLDFPWKPWENLPLAFIEKAQKARLKMVLPRLQAQKQFQINILSIFINNWTRGIESEEKQQKMGF